MQVSGTHSFSFCFQPNFKFQVSSYTFSVQIMPMRMYLISAFLLCVFCSCTKSPADIKFTAKGTGSNFMVQYVDGKGNPQTYNGLSPFEEIFTANSGANLSVSAGSGPSGTNEVHIFINGTDKAHDVETGLDATARVVVP
jgi:hypothetical protein